MRRSGWLTLNVVLLLILPAPLFIVAAISVSPDRYLAFPPTGVSLVWYLQFLASAQWMKALAISALLASVAAVISTAAATGAALALDRAHPRLRGIAETLILLPLIFPHAAIGVAMLGLLATTVYLKGTYLGIALVHVMLCGPFAYRPVVAALQKLDRSLAEAAMNLGADTAFTLTRVILPLLRPGIVTALLFTFIFSFDEATVTLFLAGPGVTTLPLEIFSHLEQNADPVVAAISTLLMLFTFSLVVVLQRTVGLQMFVSLEADDEGAGGRAAADA
jgi:putative spermidine/putrescine transport system permease protein